MNEKNKLTNNFRYKKNGGITLIALIITIIVMLILVSVTITFAVNSGLFDYAKDASVQTNEAVAKEQILGSGKTKVNGKFTTDTEIDDIVDSYK